MKLSQNLKTYLFICLSFMLVACGGGGGGDGDGDGGGGTANQSPDDAVTSGIAFTGGALRSGSPPAPTNNAGDIFLTNPASTPVSLDAGQSSQLDIGLNDVPAGQPFDVNVRFGSTTQFISIPISDPTLLNNIASNGGAGTLNLPFSMPANICDNVDDIQHQIDCYESVDVGNGVQVSTETARQMLLACDAGSGGGDFATGANDYCADDYPVEACNILNDDPGINTSYVSGSTCSSAFPSSTVLGDFDCSGSGSVFSSCGACAVEVSSGKPQQAKNVSLEEVMYNALIEYQMDPEARTRITYTPPSQ